MRNICSALRLSARTVLISGCFMGQPREFSFSEQGASQGHRQMGWEMAPSRGSCSLTARRGRFGCSGSTQRSSGLVLALWEMFHGLTGRSEPRDPVQLPRGGHQHPAHPAEQKLRPKVFRFFFIIIIFFPPPCYKSPPDSVGSRVLSEPWGDTRGPATHPTSRWDLPRAIAFKCCKNWSISQRSADCVL